MSVIPFPTDLKDLERRAQVLISLDATVCEHKETGEIIIRTGLKFKNIYEGDLVNYDGASRETRPNLTCVFCGKRK